MSIRDCCNVGQLFKYSLKSVNVSRCDFKFYLLAILSGLFYGLSFPPRGGSYLVFVVLVPLLFALVEVLEVRKAWFLGFLFGLSTGFTAVSWIFFNVGAPPVVRFFSGLSLIVVVGLFYSFFTFFGYLLLKSLGRWSIWLLPFIWLGMEQFMYYEEITFPWLMLCNTLTYNLKFIQVSDLFGSSFISFIVALFNICSFVIVSELISAKKRWFKVLLVITLFSVVWLVIENYGNKRLKHFQQILKGAENVAVGLINPSIEAEGKWRKDNLNQLLATQMRLSDSVVDSVDLIVWGEANFPGYLQLYPSTWDSFSRYSQEHQVGFLVGSLAFDKIDDSTFLRYNSTFYFNRDDLVNRYNKIKLVPFGEVFPFAQFFPLIKEISLGQANFDRGRQYTLFNLNQYKFAVSICYEGIFSYFNAEFVRRGADFLINISNDAWYEKSNQNSQHSRFNIYRAIENRRSIARLANRAESSTIMPTGELSTLFDPYEVVAKKVNLPIIREVTFFTKHHNLIKSIMVIVPLLLIGISILIPLFKKKINVKNN